MPLLQINEPRPAPSGFALFALGFRPFFVLAGMAGSLLLALWIAIFAGHGGAPAYYGPLLWHGHEMVFGYSAAVLSGFLLTAARNWTGIPTLSRWPLAFLASVWLAGRLAPFMPGLPAAMVAGVDLAFLPLFTLALAAPIVRARHTKSLLFVLIAALLAGANGLVHWQALGYSVASGLAGLYAGVDVVIWLIAILAGRVLPFFTEKAIAGAQMRRRPAVEAGAFVTIVAVALADVLPLPAPVAGTLALMAAAAHGWRLAGWYDRRIWRLPILWILHVGYAWLVVGLLLKGLAGFGVLAAALALHALTAGAIGSITLGMMARVSLGHTGYPLHTTPLVVLAFVLLNAATLVRVAGPLLFPSDYVAIVVLSGTLWAVSFAAFLIRYVPVLWRPRIDGRPG